MGYSSTHYKRWRSKHSDEIKERQRLAARKYRKLNPEKYKQLRVHDVGDGE